MIVSNLFGYPGPTELVTLGLWRSDTDRRTDTAGQPTGAADWSIDAAMPFRAVSEPVDAAHGVTDMTTPFRLLGQPIMPMRVISGPIDATDGPAHVNGDQGQAELQALISILAELRSREREAIELSFRHDLHLEQCEACASYGRGVPRPAIFSRLLPLASLPLELRKRVLRRCCSTTEDAVAYRRRVARRAEPRWFARFPQPITHVSWERIRANPGAAAAVAVLMWAAAATPISAAASSSPAATQAGLRAVHGPTVAAVTLAQAVEVAYVVALDIAFALADGLRPNREGSRASCMHM